MRCLQGIILYKLHYINYYRIAEGAITLNNYVTYNTMVYFLFFLPLLPLVTLALLIKQVCFVLPLNRVIIVVEVTSIQNPDSLKTFIWAEKNEILRVSLHVRIANICFTANLVRLYPISKLIFGRCEIF